MTFAAADEMALYRAFLEERLQAGLSFVTPEDSVTAFREYQQQIARIRDELEQARQGPLVEFSIEAVKAEVLAKLTS